MEQKDGNCVSKRFKAKCKAELMFWTFGGPDNLAPKFNVNVDLLY